MNPSKVHDVVKKINEDASWTEARCVGELVASLCGSRENGPELIELMTKISDTQDCSAFLGHFERIDKWMADVSLEEEIPNAIIRGCGKSLMDTTKPRGFLAEIIESDAFPVRVAVTGLLPPVNSSDPRAWRSRARQPRAMAENGGGSGGGHMQRGRVGRRGRSAGSRALP
jgi:hypothetical protein